MLPSIGHDDWPNGRGKKREGGLENDAKLEIVCMKYLKRLWIYQWAVVMST